MTTENAYSFFKAVLTEIKTMKSNSLGFHNGDFGLSINDQNFTCSFNGKTQTFPINKKGTRRDKNFMAEQTGHFICDATNNNYDTFLNMWGEEIAITMAAFGMQI